MHIPQVQIVKCVWLQLKSVILQQERRCDHEII